MTINFGKKKIGAGHPVFIIAEIGINHEGSLETCLEMVRKAAWAGADSIKLQTVDADENYVKGHPSWTLFRTCALTKDETDEVFQLSRELGMEPFTTSPDPATLSWVDQLDVPGHKISSGMMTNDVIIKKTCALGKPVLISTGMAGTEQIDHAVDIAKAGNSDIALFQCTSEYPAPFDSLNLATIDWMRQRYDLPVGFSDHSEGTEAAVVAVSLGAVMIEKHFSLDCSRPGFDHKISLDPEGFKALVDGVRAAETGGYEFAKTYAPHYDKMIGSAERVLPAHIREKAAANLRCLVARRPIKKGEKYTEDNVGLKRPFADRRGLEPMHYDMVLEKYAVSDLEIDDPIKIENVA